MDNTTTPKEEQIKSQQKRINQLEHQLKLMNQERKDYLNKLGEIETLLRKDGSIHNLSSDTMKEKLVEIGGIVITD